MKLDERIVRLMITGRVQGVGFRVFVEDEARGRGLRGWVRNRRDGAVEAVLAGPIDAISAAIEACRRGPSSARVKAVDVQDAETTALEQLLPGEDFSVLPSA
jgi:acylphosphatase